jgi:hypothetical protein
MEIPIEITFKATPRDDGTMFVTSVEIPFFSAVAIKNDWAHVFELARMHLVMNGVNGLRSNVQMK